MNSTDIIKFCGLVSRAVIARLARFDWELNNKMGGYTQALERKEMYSSHVCLAVPDLGNSREDALAHMAMKELLANGTEALVDAIADELVEKLIHWDLMEAVGNAKPVPGGEVILIGASGFTQKYPDSNTDYSKKFDIVHHTNGVMVVRHKQSREQYLIVRGAEVECGGICLNKMLLKGKLPTITTGTVTEGGIDITSHDGATIGEESIGATGQKTVH